MPFIVAFGVAVALTPLAGWVAARLGLVDRPGDLKIHARAVPLSGGIGAVAAAFVAIALVTGRHPASVLSATLIALAIGVVDDARPLPPGIRLAAQAAAGAVLAASLPLPSPEPVFAAAVVLLAIACANAVNLIDGQDGLAGGLAAAAALGLAAVVGISSPAGHVQLALAGGLCGFLVFNRPPARVFLGNGGAYATGTLLAAGAVRSVAGEGWAGLAGAGLCLGVFAFEMVFTVARRIAGGAGLTSGDRSHTYDLASRRHGRTRVTAWFCAAGAAAAVAGVAVVQLPPVGILAAAGTLASAAWAGSRLWRWSVDDDDETAGARRAAGRTNDKEGTHR